MSQEINQTTREPHRRYMRIKTAEHVHFVHTDNVLEFILGQRTVAVITVAKQITLIEGVENMPEILSILERDES